MKIGDCMAKWKNVELGEVVTLKRGYDLPQQKRVAGTIPIFSSSGINGYHNTAMVKGPGVVTGRYGTIGQVFFADQDFWPLNTTLYVEDFHGNDPAFIYYFLKTLDWNSFTSASAVPGINRNTVHKTPVTVPDLGTQRKIASVFKSLDDKITLNSKINDNLEQQTQVLYQKYFSETDNTGVLADLCDFSKDKIAVSEISVKNYFSTENMLSDKKGTTEAANLPAVEQTTACHIGNVLVSNIRPYFKKILYCQCEGGCSADVLCFVPKIPELSAYLYCTLYADKFFDFMVAGSKGTKMPRGDKKQIMTYSVCLPSENELKNFNAAVLPMFQLIESNRRENARLSLLRDTLLPKLMAGEIDIEDVI